MEEVGLERINAHVMGLTDQLLGEMRGLRHSNGKPMTRIYGPVGTEDRGGTIAFNLLDPTGAIVDCRLIEEASSAAGVSLRTGYFCNPGAAESSFELPEDEARRCFDDLAGDTFTLKQFSACLHDRPVGAVRVSLGVSSNESDLGRLLEILTAFRDQASPEEAPMVTASLAG